MSDKPNVLPEENPYEPSQVEDLAARRRGRRALLVLLGIILVPVASIICGFVSCFTTIVGLQWIGDDVAVAFGFMAGLVGAAFAAWGTLKLLGQWRDSS